MKLKPVPCIRCGVCCLLGPCSFGFGSENVRGVCKHLTIHKKNYASCKLYDPKKTMWQAGCALRAVSAVYVLYKEIAEERIGHKLKGLEVWHQAQGY